MTAKERALLSRHLLSRYSLPADLSMQSDRPRPLGWIDPEKEPQRFLGVGAPVRLKRRSARLIFPYAALSELVYFQGTSSSLSLLNTAIDFWAKGELVEALRLLDDLAVSQQKSPSGDHERMVIHLTRGYLRLAFFAGKTWGHPTSERDAAVWKALARDDFREGILTPSLYAYITGVDATLDADTYLKSGKSVFYLAQDKMPQLKPGDLGAPRRSMQPLVWIRSIAPWALLNMMSLSDEQGEYGRAFAAAERLDALRGAAGPIFRTQDAATEGSFEPVISADHVPSIGKSRFLRPRGFDDIVSLSRLMRAQALEKQHLESLMQADQAVRTAVSSEIAAVGFEFMGRIYYDLHSDIWARRLFAWSEMLAPSLLETFPDALLWGAESSLWRGGLDRSRLGFQKLRDLLSDREYGPDVALRLLQFDLLGGWNTATAAQLEYLRTHYAGSPPTHIAPDIVTLDFCHSAPGLTPRARQVEYLRTKEAIAKARIDLREQAAACLLAADLELARETSFAAGQPEPGGRSKGHKVRADASSQLALIKAFDGEFRNSPFRRLFAQRERLASLGTGFGLLADNDCPQALAFFMDNKGELLKTTAISDSPVAGLSWKEHESEKLARCAAAFDRLDVWKALQAKAPLEKSVLRESFFAWRSERNSARLLSMRNQLVSDTNWSVFDALRGGIDSLNTASLDDEAFWRLLSAREIVASEPGDPADEFFEEPLNHVLSSSKSGKGNATSIQSQVCSWSQKSLRASGKAGQRRLEAFASSPWLAAISTKSGLDLGNPALCLTRLTAQVVGIAASRPMDWSDDLLLWPYIEKVGVLPQADVAVDLAMRTHQRTGEVSDAVLNVLSVVAERGTDPSLRDQARRWIRSHVLKQRPEVW